MISNSHPATKQDLWVLEKLGPTGTFCEVGAFDGVTHSNTLLLEQQGWRGSLIEGHRPFFEQCVKNRPDTRCWERFIGPCRSYDSVFVGGQYTGVVGYMPESWRMEHRRRKAKTYRAETHPLIDYVCYVDYLSIDTEGGEYEILDSWFRDGGACDALTVEFRYDQDYLIKLVRLCEDYEYKLDEIRGFDACFLRVK